MKKTIAIILVLTIITNIFGFGFMNIRAGAELATAAVVTILGLVSGFVGTGLGGLLANATDDFINRLSDSQKDLIYKINYNAIKNGELIQIDWLQKDCFVPVEGLTGEKLEFAEYFCDKLNSSEDLEQILKGFGYSYDGQAYVQDSPDTMERDISSLNYAKFKSECINAFNEYMALNNYIEGAQNLAETGAFPTYDFEFVGPLDPLTHITIPGSETIVETDLDGFLHCVPWIIERSDGYYSVLPQGWQGINVTTYSNKTVDGVKYYNAADSGRVTGYNCAGVYVVYNGELFYSSRYTSGQSTLGITEYLNDSRLSTFANSNGESLKSKGCNSLVGLYGGVYVWNNKNTSGRKPTTETAFDDLKEIQPQKDILYPLDDDEAAIGESIAAGLLPQDFMLKLNELGNIISANNIPIEQLTSLLENLKEGQLKFDDFEQYLQYISALLSAGNIDRQTSAKILNNIRSLQEQTNDNINVVNTAISGIKELDEERNDVLARIDANIAALTEALTAAQEGDITKESTDLDAVVGNHVGLSEANQFVSNWALMNQFKGLLYNVLDRYDQSGSEPPNFNFYWDSNKDGVAEKYTFLDLSILETSLDNSNLEDKDRFKNSMTVREFIQLLIILVCYVAFIIKMLRKLPGLVSGGESSMDTGFELTKAQNEHIAKVSRSVNKGE